MERKIWRLKPITNKLIAYGQLLMSSYFGVLLRGGISCDKGRWHFRSWVYRAKKFKNQEIEILLFPSTINKAFELSLKTGSNHLENIWYI